MKLTDGSVTRAYYIILFTFIEFDSFHNKMLKIKKPHEVKGKGYNLHLNEALHFTKPFS